MITPKGSHAMAGCEDVLACFDATAASTFSWICRLVGSDGDLADNLLADVYLSLRRATVDGTLTEVDDDWLISTAFHLADHFDRTHGPLHADLSVRHRAVLDLDLGRQHGAQRDRETIARIVGIPADDLVAALAEAERAAGVSTIDSLADVLRRSERWLDDSTRRRARSAIVRGERSRTAPRPASGAPPNRPLELISASSSSSSSASASASTSPAPVGGRSTPPPSGPGAELGRPRRLMIGVAAGIAALLAVGFIWITPDDSAERGGDASAASTNSSTPSSDDIDRSETTSAPSTTEPTPTRPPLAPDATRLTLSPGFILGEPLGDFEPVSVWEELAADWKDQPADSWRQIWSEPGASRTNGRWFAIAIGPWDSFTEVYPAGSVRVSFDGHPGVVTTATDGVSGIEMMLGPEPAEGPTVELVGYGLGLDEMRVLAGAVVWDETASLTDIAEIEFGPSAVAVLQRMTLVESRPTVCCGVRPYRVEGDRRSADYRAGPPDENGRFLTLSTLDGWSNELVSRFLEPSSPDPAAPTNPERTLQIEDRTVTVAGDVYAYGATDYVYNTARWFEGNQTIEISGNVDLATLLAAVSAARPATRTEWRELGSLPYWEEYSEDDWLPPPFTSIGDVQLADGTTWTLAMSFDPAMIQLEYRGRGGSGSAPWQPFIEDPSRPVRELVTIGATVLVITLRDPPVGAAVRVSVAGREPAVVRLFPIGESGLVGAIDAFGELPPYTVELVDEAGTTLQLLSS